MIESPPSRPRVEGDRENEILEAVVDVLIEVGYDKLTFDLVSARAKVSKATLYRRWPSKAALVMAGVSASSECRAMHAPFDDHGSLAADLRALQGRIEAKTPKASEVIGAISPATQRDEQLREAFVQTFTQPQIDVFKTVLVRARERGEIRADADVELLARVVPAMAVHHSHVNGVKPDSAYLMHVVTTVLLPEAGTDQHLFTPHDPERRG